MKLRLSQSIVLLFLASQAYAAYLPKESAQPAAPGKFYFGGFGGRGSSNDIDASMYGTIFFTEANGGPLSVNAFGELKKHSSSFWGGQVGYQASEIKINCSSPIRLAAAIELEGYELSDRTYSGHLINDTTRIPEHDFQVKYPMERSVFLANAILNFNYARNPVHPYVGMGFGEAIFRISGAKATQTDPFEANINHYNAKKDDRDTTFAGQIKVGLSVDISQHLSLFADYRWLYVANTHFGFGSTVYPTHAPSSSWQINLDKHRYNLGNLGIRWSI